MKTKEQPAEFLIRLEGHLGKSATIWFPEMQIEIEKNGHTALCGQVNDQAALFGLLDRIRDLGLKLILVQRLEKEQDPDRQTGEDSKE